jgi:branched-chain amino acid transport system ATP-binding protein
MMMAEALLDVTSLAAGYGAAMMLGDIAFTVPEGGSLAVLGRNGVGKSTLMLTLMGHTRMREGSIRLRGVDITEAPTYQRVALGLGFVPQEREVFPSLTVDEHFTFAARKGPWTPSRIYDLFPALEERRNYLGRHLSGGEQQMLAIGRALTTNPALLLLDEPLEGLAPVVVKNLKNCIRRLIETEGVAVIVVEQHARLVLQLCRDAIVLERGRIVHASPSLALREDPVLLDRLVGMRRRPGEDKAQEAIERPGIPGTGA